MEIEDIRKLLGPQFGYWAKSTGELLYAHHFAVWSVFRKIAKYCPSLDKGEMKILEIASLMHDIGKMRKEVQSFLRGISKIHPPHKINEQDVIEYIKLAKWSDKLNPQQIKKITDIILTHHSVSDKDLLEIDTSGAGFYTSLLITADRIASMDRISYDTISKLKRLYNGKIDFAIFEYSRFLSPTADLILARALESFKKMGWDVLCFPENSIVFISQPENPLPKKQELIEEILSEVIQESLSMQKPIPTGLTGDHLALLSRDFPDEFIKIHKESILNALGDVDRKATVFLKLLRDILSVRGLITPQARNEAWLLDLVESANSTGAHRKAKDTYKKIFKKPAPSKINPEFFKPLFKNATLNNILPKTIPIKSSTEVSLSKLKPKELYDILQSAAGEGELKKKKPLAEYLNCLISLEEEADFEKIAQEIFKKYKEYKRTSIAEKGCCERCGCPVATKMQPALKIPGGSSQAFSQIKPAYAYRSICAFCGYDNLTLRKDISGDWITIYLRLETKVPDLLIHHEEIIRLVNIIRRATSNPRVIIKFEERPLIAGLPFPERVEIPVAEEVEINREGKQHILLSEHGLMIELDRIRIKDFTPKDAKARYEPLYHIMKFLGFKVAIGTEEQEGLFGEEVETNERTYYKSLAIILLAGMLEKKEKKYVFASNLLEKSPSISIRTIGVATENRFLPEGLIKCLLRTMMKSNLIVATWKEVN